MSKTPTAYTIALSHFTRHADAVEQVEQIHRAADSVEARLTAAANTEKPDFSKVSALHSERQHQHDRLQRAAATVANLEDGYIKAGFALYHAASAARARAAAAAEDCVHARLAEDFPDREVRAFVARRHPVAIAEDARNAYVPSPSDLPTFAAFAAAVPGIVQQIEQADARTAIYEKATASRSLPSQSALDGQTPEAAKPVAVAVRRELTPAEEAEQVRKLTSAENHRLQALYTEGRAIAGDFNENADALAVFISRHPEVARFFPIRRTA